MFGALKRGRFRSLASLSYTCSECCWRTSTEKNTCGIARFLCGSTAFLLAYDRTYLQIKLLELETSNSVGGFVLGLGMPSGRTNNFPESGRGLGHVTPTILAVRSAILATAWLLVL